MPHKHLLFRSAAREKVLAGATALADAVRVTLGPKSKCVLIGKPWGRPARRRIVWKISRKNLQRESGVATAKKWPQLFQRAVSAGPTSRKYAS
jgi:chaperonin GroEL